MQPNAFHGNESEVGAEVNTGVSVANPTGLMKGTTDGTLLCSHGIFEECRGAAVMLNLHPPFVRPQNDNCHDGVKLQTMSCSVWQEE